MTPEESRRDEAARWLAQARKDLNAARLLVTAEPLRSAFHSRQAAEKGAKAFLYFTMSSSARPTT
jgi:HEPN domain-containing protein